MFQGRVYQNARSRKTISTVCFLTVGEGKKVPLVVADGKKAAVATTGRRRRVAQNAGVERRRAREMSWAERRVALQTNNLGRLNPVKRRTLPPPPSLPSCTVVPLPRSSRPPLSTIIQPRSWRTYVLSRRSREDRRKPEIVVNYCAADMWRLASV